MPCNSEYLNASDAEIELSKVESLLDEIRTGKLNKDHFSGYHPAVYNKHRDSELDHVVTLLCMHLQDGGATKHSLEMQMWWRDHQEADRKRLKREMKAHKDDEHRQAALSKLTEYERNLLGL